MPVFGNAEVVDEGKTQLVLDILSEMIVADENISDDQIAVACRSLNASGLFADVSEDELRDALEVVEEVPAEELIQRAHEDLDDDERWKVFESCLRVAYENERIDSGENELLGLMEREWELPEDRVQEFFAALKAASAEKSEMGETDEVSSVEASSGDVEGRGKMLHDAMADVFEENRSVFGEDDYAYIAAGIPKTALRNAIETFAPRAADESAVCLLNNTILSGDGKKGLLVTDGGLYANNTLERPRNVEWSDVLTAEYSGGWFSAKNLYINGNHLLKGYVGSTDTLDCLSQIVRALASRLNPVLRSITSGELPQMDCDLLLQDGESCHWVSGAHMITMEKELSYGSSGVSFRPLASSNSAFLRSFRLNTRRGKIKKKEVEKLESGKLYITTNRIVFDGENENKSIKIDKVMKVGAEGEQLEIAYSYYGDKVARFAVPAAEIVAEVIRLVFNRD